MDVEQQNGFTMIDLLVGIGIITMIFGVVLFNFRSSADDDLYANARTIFLNDLRRVHTWGVAGRQYLGQYPADGYGVAFESCGSAACAYESEYSILTRDTIDTVVSTEQLLGLTTIDAISFALSGQPEVWQAQTGDLVIEFNLESVAVYVSNVVQEDVVGVKIDFSYPGIAQGHSFELNTATGLMKLYEL